MSCLLPNPALDFSQLQAVGHRLRAESWTGLTSFPMSGALPQAPTWKPVVIYRSGVSTGPSVGSGDYNGRPTYSAYLQWKAPQGSPNNLVSLAHLSFMYWLPDPGSWVIAPQCCGGGCTTPRENACLDPTWWLFVADSESNNCPTGLLFNPANTDTPPLSPPPPPTPPFIPPPPLHPPMLPPPPASPPFPRFPPCSPSPPRRPPPSPPRRPPLVVFVLPVAVALYIIICVCCCRGRRLRDWRRRRTGRWPLLEFIARPPTQRQPPPRPPPVELTPVALPIVVAVYAPPASPTSPAGPGQWTKGGLPSPDVPPPVLGIYPTATPSPHEPTVLPAAPYMHTASPPVMMGMPVMDHRVTPGPVPVTWPHGHGPLFNAAL